jgi:hypothetical protein
VQAQARAPPLKTALLLPVPVRPVRTAPISRTQAQQTTLLQQIILAQPQRVLAAMTKLL